MAALAQISVAGSSYRFVRAEEANHSVRLMCSVLEISRSSYHVWRVGQSHTGSKDARVLVHIRAIYSEHRGRYGAPRVAVELRTQGLTVNRKRVAKLMREEGLKGAPRRVFRWATTDSAHEDPTAPKLIQRDRASERPNLVVVGDITYLPTGSGWVYLAGLIDLFSRKVVGWAMDDTMETSLCLRALERTLATWVKMEGATFPHGSRLAMREESVPAGTGEGGAAAAHEPDGRLLGQRARGELLRTAQAGAEARARLAGPP